MVAEAAERQADHDDGPWTAVRTGSVVPKSGLRVRQRFLVAPEAEEHPAEQVARPPLVAACDQSRLELADDCQAAFKSRGVGLVTVERRVRHDLDLGDQGSLRDLVGT